MKQNLHRIAGSTFQREKVGLCERCAFRRDCGEWQGYCTARNKVLSYEPKRKKKSRCADFRPA